MFKCSTCQSMRPLDCAIRRGCPILKDLDFFLVIHFPDAELFHYFSSSHDLSCSIVSSHYPTGVGGMEGKIYITKF